ncbi:MAG: Xaa-Pro dipeptidase [Acidobacteria bacterium]|nr:Xaa-Pro dipeptidase [Acidobacteriota bacterium]MCB9398195.1 Xaa-Pro dipeptidase [Acidobacteriota bacterium]
MPVTDLFADHIQTLQNRYEETLDLLQKNGVQIDAVLSHSGTESYYFADDHAVVFKAHHHLLHWLPVNRPDQMVMIQPGKKPVFFQVVPTDFWYEQDFRLEQWVADSFDVVSLSSPEQVLDHLPATRRIAFLGENTEFASQMGLPSNLHNEKNLRNRLDYARSLKTPYEVERIRIANQRALKGHEAAYHAFMEGASEWEIHMRYLQACGQLEQECPYGNIVALDEKGAILHYQGKRQSSGKDSKVLLIDAGSMDAFYCSDITRTYAREDAHPVFRSLVEKMDALQLDLVQKVHVGVPYLTLHEAAHDGVLDILLAENIVQGDREKLKDMKISSLFFPHGIGHLLGLQVHDVSGHFKDETGVLAPPPEDHRFLRLTRKMEAGMVFTIEPGLYFIPVLLDPERATEKGATINWKLVDALIPLGGIRIEDNILVTEKGPQNLTR